ncbi:hypothetical protein MTP04_03020 [Lysinibacillus sp. PLM2]|nr:hypothetical protein MTP04_03020 [Lysinibacillus sp. PLM2]
MKNFSLLFVVLFVFILGACSAGNENASSGEKITTAASGEGSALDFSKPVTILVHTSAGGPTDLMARELAKAAEDVTGGTFIVENRPGGSGAVQMAEIANAKADGYTLGAMTPSQIGLIEGTLKEQYDLEDFSWISQGQIDPYVIVVHKDSPFNTLQDLVDYAKENPGKLTVGGYGAVGSGHNVAWNIFADEASIETTWTAYESTGDAVTAILGNHIDIANSNPGQVIQYYESGDLKILGVMSDVRLEELPNVPTYKEAGFDVDTSWAQFRGVYGPAGIDESTLQQLSDIFEKAMATENYQTYLKNSQMLPGDMDYKEFTDYINSQAEIMLNWYEKLGVE